MMSPTHEQKISPLCTLLSQSSTLSHVSTLIRSQLLLPFLLARVEFSEIIILDAVAESCRSLVFGRFRRFVNPSIKIQTRGKKQILRSLLRSTG